jgi:hypothetical protein
VPDVNKTGLRTRKAERAARNRKRRITDPAPEKKEMPLVAKKQKLSVEEVPVEKPKPITLLLNPPTMKRQEAVCQELGKYLKIYFIYYF